MTSTRTVSADGANLAFDHEPLRAEVHAWLDAHPTPTPAELAGAGWIAPGWPAPWGRGLDDLSSLVVHEELARHGVTLPHNPIGIGWAGPTILAGGSPAQQERYLLPILTGEEFWCQLFSEPDAGSDLANIATRAHRDGDTFVINGSKIWSTWAERADFGIMIARTDPDAPKHRGISYFVCPMDAPGVTVRPIREMTGESHFNETFFDDVRLSADHLIGAEHGGWALTKLTLANERLHLSRGGLCWGLGPTGDDFFELVRRHGPVEEPLLRQRLAGRYIEHRLIELFELRILAGLRAGHAPGPAASLKKMLADEHAQRLFELAKELSGPGGLLDTAGPLGAPVDRWHWGFLFSRALTIGGGTAQVQRNVVAERLLGLPGAPDPTAGRPWTRSRS